jgi:hypothetical protein
MAQQIADTPEDLAVKGLRYTKEQFDDILTQTEGYVRQNPGQAVLYAFVAGYVMNRLPVGRVATGLVRLSLLALKPAVLLYGASKLYQATRDE